MKRRAAFSQCSISNPTKMIYLDVVNADWFDATFATVGSFAQWW